MSRSGGFKDSHPLHTTETVDKRWLVKDLDVCFFFSFCQDEFETKQCYHSSLFIILSVILKIK